MNTRSSKLPQPKMRKNKLMPATMEKDPFADAISTEEFLRQIKLIQRSNDKNDVALRDAATEYMNNLHSV